VNDEWLSVVLLTTGVQKVTFWISLMWQKGKQVVCISEWVCLFIFGLPAFRSPKRIWWFDSKKFLACC